MSWILTRKDFFRSSAAVAASAVFPRLMRTETSDESALLSIGIMTDTHYADLEMWGNRYYRESLEKMSECVDLMNDRRVDLMIHLGDLVNGAPDNNPEHLRQAEQIYARFRGPRCHVLGNHDMDALSKRQVTEIIDNERISPEQTWYSLDMNGIHIVVLDACFREDGTPYDEGNFHWTDCYIPERQLEWLSRDLAEADGPALICVHQLLDGDGADDYFIGNSKNVRRILESSGRVAAVFQGHRHSGRYSRINGIHYHTFRAVVEGSGEQNNAYSIAEIHRDGSMEITGYRRAESRTME